jgi:hypothetical protein
VGLRASLSLLNWGLPQDKLAPTFYPNISYNLNKLNELAIRRSSMILSSEILTSIAQDLSKSKEAKRAKKLVFYITQRYWETDFNVINSYAWEELLQSLYENNPTREDLKALLYHAVKTLNRKHIYVRIAQYILKRMSSLYNDSGHGLLAKNSEVNQFDRQRIDTIVEHIQHHVESARLKKLIFAVYKQYWENDVNIIDTYDLGQILLELHQLYPNTKSLRKELDNLVANINRQNFYSFIADTIVGELTYLYQYEPVSVLNNSNEQEEEESETKLILGSQTPSKQSPSPPQETIQNQEKTGFEENSSPSQTQTNAVDNNVAEGQVISWLKIDNLFDLKQEIMQYSNPLRAKIILFYTIYRINPAEQHWSIVRTCTLNDLLAKMFQNYGQNIEQIESHLTEIAKSNLEGLDLQENLQTVSVIVEALKHFYQKR